MITDWTTTGIDGPRLCRRIRGLADHPYTYLIVMTSRGADADRLECLYAGADDFLTRPTDVRELAARLEIARRILAMQEELERKNARLAELVTINPLTGLKNRRHFREALEAAFALATRGEQPLSVVMLDVDEADLDPALRPRVRLQDFGQVEFAVGVVIPLARAPEV